MYHFIKNDELMFIKDTVVNFTPCFVEQDWNKSFQDREASLDWEFML